MKDWMRVNYDWGLPIGVFTLNAREALMYGIREILTLCENDPAAVCDRVTALILLHRPEMVGGTLVRIAPRHQGMGVDLFYVHPQFAKDRAVEQGMDFWNDLPRLDLIPLPSERVAVPKPDVVADFYRPPSRG